MSSYKQLNKADVTTTNYRANKRWNLNYPSSSINNDPYTSIYKGTYITGTFNPNNPSIDPITSGQYERLVYDSINHLFYQSYIDTLNTSSLMFNVETYTSASQQRPTSSYFDYNNNPLLIKQFPTGAGAEIRVLSINQDTYGSKVLPNSFAMLSSAYNIKDDGNGNLYDISGVGDDYIDLNYLTIAFINGYFDDLTPGAGVQRVGNIFYAHGIVVITNPDYQNIFPLPPIANNDSFTYTTYPGNPYNPSITFNILNNDLPRTGILNTGSVVLYGSNAPYYTVNPNGTLTLTGSAPAGNCSVFYTVNNIFNNGTSSLTSNQALINMNLVASTSECILYQFSGSSVDAKFNYVTCSALVDQEELVGQNIINRCINANYIPLLTGGTGSITIISDCS
jgi:hypothetical protein